MWILIPMAGQVFIDGNNLLYAMHAHAPTPNVGRETLARIIDRWAKRTGQTVMLVFDGPVPRGGLAAQMQTERVLVRFSAPATADDLIVELVAKADDPAKVRVVTSDTAIAHEARYRRCAHTDAASFVAELFSGADDDGSSGPPDLEQHTAPQAPSDSLSPADKRRWLEEFGFDPDEDEPFPGHGAMIG